MRLLWQPEGYAGWREEEEEEEEEREEKEEEEKEEGWRRKIINEE